MKNALSTWASNSSESPTPLLAPAADSAIAATRFSAEQLLLPALSLTWPSSPHTLEFFQGKDSLEGKFTIRKEEVTQTITVPLPEGITTKDIRTAWIEQGEKWQQLGTSDSPVTIDPVGEIPRAFTAVRVIHIPGKDALVWYILHVNNKQSFDSCVFMDALDLTKFAEEEK